MESIYGNENELLSDIGLVTKILNNPFIGICVTDEKGVCILLNDTHKKISGMAQENFIGKNMCSLANNNTISVSSTAQVLRTGREVNLFQTNATNKSYDVKGVPVYNEYGKIKYVVNYLLDVTEMEKFKDLISQLKEDKEEAENKIKRLTQAQKMDGEIVFCSDKMKRTIDVAKKVAKHDSSVLICGPSGSGKELIANLIHANSLRKSQPFIKINCAAIPDQLLESELFGYEPGAFTGGNPRGSTGIFEAANGGSLLLDEIGEMPMNLQAKLLRVLQNQEVRRIGSDISTQVDVRIIASTNASILDLIQEKKFREDLYYRLNVVEIDVPHLEERKQDIPTLIAHFIKHYNTKYDENKSIRWDGIKYLMECEYPGNIRELKNVVERVLVQNNKEEITYTDVVNTIGKNKCEHSIDKPILDIQGCTLKELMDNYEKQILCEGLSIYHNAENAAKHMGIDRSTMSRKLHKHDLK